MTTKPYRDGGPDEGILMLGQEPSLIESRVELSDYSARACDFDMTPAEFLDRFKQNPDFQRVINSTLIASASQGSGEDVSVEEQNDFVTSTVVRRAVYSK